MKPLYKLTEKNKSTYFSLCIGDIGLKITDRCNKWFTDVFINKSSYIGEDVYTDNLLLDLNYMFSQALWLIKLAKREKFDVKDSKSHIEHLYKIYTGRDGHRGLVTDERYNSLEHRVWTDDEILVNKKRVSEVVQKIWEELSE